MPLEDHRNLHAATQLEKSYKTIPNRFDIFSGFRFVHGSENRNGRRAPILGTTQNVITFFQCQGETLPHIHGNQFKSL